jgi:hypothetical protein
MSERQQTDRSSRNKSKSGKKRAGKGKKCSNVLTKKKLYY